MITPLPNPFTQTHLMPPPLSQLTSAYNSKNNKPEQRYLRGIHLPKSLIITGFYFSAAPRYNKSDRPTHRTNNNPPSQVAVLSFMHDNSLTLFLPIYLSIELSI